MTATLVPSTPFPRERCAPRPMRTCALAWLITVLMPAQLPAQPLAAPASAWATARQLIVVTTADWNADQGTLRRYERDADRWRAVATADPVALGRAGSGWGLGLHPAQPGPQKREGDGRSPAGVFAIGTAFGYAATDATALPYAALGADDWCIDTSGSPLYNRIVDARAVGAEAVAGSTEPMRRDLHLDGDERYRIGFVIAHNPRGVANAGSCIFAHIWKSAGSSTAGCTAMSATDLRAVMDWLRPDDHPVFVLMPQREYDRLQRDWNLPAIARTGGGAR